MKQDRGKRALEAYRVFPYVAWVLTFGFAVFVYNIVTELQAVTLQLQSQTEALERQIAADPRQADFDSYNDDRFQSGRTQE